jgi:hypothetical protein
VKNDRAHKRWPKKLRGSWPARSTSPSQSDDRLLGRPPTGFSESDVGGPPGAECDVGRMLDGLVSSELETTLLTDDIECCQEWRYTPYTSGIRVRTPAQTSAGKKVPTPQDCCLTMDSKRFQTCPELVEGCQN